ncbi:MAG TPA: hypothetical protein VFZ65_12040 [Planctomycetota bacterium]|nr:hypothetical protein [Planctomycetota bacterium]
MKRLLLFLLLLGLGIAALRLAIGDDDALGGKLPAPDRQPRPNTPGLPVHQGNVGASVAQTGYLRLPRYRTLAQPDGSQVQQQVFLLEAKDSQPIGEGRQQLEGVDVTLFDAGAPAATLVARQAFVELARDANGRPSLREDKDIDLRDAVFTTLPGTKMAGLRLELGNARVLVGEHDLLIRTADPNDPVLLVVEGEHKGTLRGKGLRATLPRERTGDLQSADIEILSDPVLETDGLVVRARGRMHYVEHTTQGAATVTVDDDVQLELASGRLALPGFGGDEVPSADAGGTGSTAHGDRFVGWLLRDRNRVADRSERNDATWRMLQLTGAPARVDVPGAQVFTTRLSIQPGPFGEAYLITAHGGPSRIEQQDLRDGRTSDPVVGTSERRIHLVQPGQGPGAVHRSFGFPQWTLGALQHLQVVVFEGRSRLVEGARSLDASRGLHVFRSNEAGADGGVVRGFGDVRVEQPATKPGEENLLATGNDGFWLQRTGSSQHLRLGPELPADPEQPGQPWRSHHYDVHYGDGHLRGVGCCDVERTGLRTHLRLRAPAAEIEGRLTGDDADLTGVRRLDALLEARELLALDVAGLPARCSIVRGDETLQAAAPHMVQLGPRSLRLLPVPYGPERHLWVALPPECTEPELTRTVAASPGKPAQRVFLQGPQIDIHHAGGNHVLVDAAAVADWRPFVRAEIGNPGGGAPTTVSCNAERLRLLPFVLTPEMRRLHAGGAVGPLADVLFHSVGNPWLVVDDVRDFHLEDDRYGLIEGLGHRLLLSQGAEAALFVGDPDTMAPAEVRRTDGGRIVTTRGAQVRVLHDEGVRVQALRTFADRPTFLLPSVTLHEPGKDGLLSHMIAVCRGNIDVLPEEVVFGGPVVAQGLNEDGSENPDGVHLEAEQLRMQRQPQTGEIVKVTGRVVTLDWSKMKARSASAELDARWNRMTFSDPADAVVSMPDGREWRSPFIEVNYETMSVKWHPGRLVQKDLAQDVAK